MASEDEDIVMKDDVICTGSNDPFAEVELQPLYSEKQPLADVLQASDTDDETYANKENEGQLKALAAKANILKEKLLKLGYPELGVLDFHDNLIGFIDRVLKRGASFDLMEALGDKSTSLCDYLVVIFRLFISAYLQENADFFQAFMDGSKSIKQFCSDEVEPMSTEADHVQITALTSALDIPIEVVYLDRSLSPLNIFRSHDKASDIKLLYKPSHYDILY